MITTQNQRVICRVKEQKQTTERYTLADLENWSEVARDIDPPIQLGICGDRWLPSPREKHPAESGPC